MKNIMFALTFTTLLSGCDLTGIKSSDSINAGAVLGGTIGAIGGYAVSQLFSPSVTTGVVGAVAGALGGGFIGQKWAEENKDNNIVQNVTNLMGNK